MHCSNGEKVGTSVIILNLRADTGHDARTPTIWSPNFNHYTVSDGFKFRKYSKFLMCL